MSEEGRISELENEVAALKCGAEERNSYIEMLEQQNRVSTASLDIRDAKIAELSKPKLPEGGIHAGSSLVGGNVYHPPRTRDEGRIHVADQY